LINVSLGETFTLTTEKYPDLVAINSYSQNVTMTYEQAFKKSLELATALIKKLHLKPKDRIGIYSYNKWEWYIIQMAAGLADLILVNINPAYQSEELAFTLQKVGLKVLFMSDQFKNSDYLGIIKKILP
jgi:fatty-acyl-CoA synthase